MDLASVLSRDVEYFLPPASARQPVATVLRAELARLGSDELQQAIEGVLAGTEAAQMPIWSIRVGARQPVYAANELLEGAGINEPPWQSRTSSADVGCCCTAGLPDALSALLIEQVGGAVIAAQRRTCPHAPALHDRT